MSNIIVYGNPHIPPYNPQLENFSNDLSMTLLTFVDTREAIGVTPVKDYMQSLIGDWPLLSANYNDSKFDWKQALT